MTGEGARGGTAMVTAVIAIVSVAFAVTAFLRPLAPGEPQNDQLLQHGDFVRMGVKEPIRWNTGRRAALAKARSEDKPLLIVLSRSGSPSGRQLDALAFTDPELGEQVNRLFVPVRIDLDEEPEWESVILPFRRLSLSPETGFEILAVSPDRGLAAWTVKYRVTDRLDFSGFAAFLTRARREAEAPSPALAEAHRVEWSRSQMPTGQGSVHGWVRDMAQAVSHGQGWRPYGDRVELEPMTWLALIDGGEADEAQLCLRAASTSPMLEGVRGLYLSFSNQADGSQVQGVMSLIQNSQAAAAAARLSLVTGEEKWAALSRRICRGIEACFLSDRGAAATLTDARGPTGARMGLSVGIPQIWSQLGPRQRAIAGEVFGLDKPGNPRMVPHPEQLDRWLAGDPDVEAVRAQIAAFQDPDALEPGGVDLAVPTCLAAAGVLEAGALLDDPAVASLGRRLFARGQLFRTGADDLVQTRYNTKERMTCLASYLAYAQACLWMHAAEGDEAALHDGLAVLKKAWRKFSSGGDLAGIQDPILPLWDRSSWPLGWVDGMKPSDASLALETTSSYAALFHDAFLQAKSDRLRQLLRPLLFREHPKTAGLARAFLRADSIRTVPGIRAFRAEAALAQPLPLVGLPRPTPAKTAASSGL